MQRRHPPLIGVRLPGLIFFYSTINGPKQQTKQIKSGGLASLGTQPATSIFRLKGRDSTSTANA